MHAFLFAMHAFLFALSIIGLACLSHASVAQDVSGPYHIDSPSGPLRLTLQQEAGRVAGTLVGFDGTTYQVQGTVVVDEETGAAAVEGTLTNPQGRAVFTLDAPDEDGDHLLSITPVDATGTPDEAQTVVFFAQRGTAATANPAPSPPVPPATAADGAVRDPRLVGVWAAQVIMNTPGGSMATQLVMEFQADGLLIEHGSRAVGSFPGAGLDTGAGGGGETASWRTQGDVLVVSYAGSPWTPFARFEVAGDRLLLTYLQDGARQLWYRE